MFPNPQEALPLPSRPNLEQYKKLAKDLVKTCKSVDPQAIRTWASQWVDTLMKLSRLSITPGMPVQVDRWIDEITEFAERKLKSGAAECALADAQFVIALSHGFESWPKFAKHIQEMARGASEVSSFEAAADAIVSGDVETLERLLRQDREIARSRSTREHQATLLHYVSANGVEGYRQKTPKNIVRIAQLLVDTGADIDAEADVFGGGSTALGLAATSIHPERAGVQEDLMALLLERGAAIDHARGGGNRSSIVNACLANGRGRAAKFLAERGARLDLEAAGGVGRLDVVKSFFQADGSLKPPTTKTQMERSFLWACEYGRNAVIEFLLQKGVDLQARADSGLTGLHWAIVGGQLETIKLLLDRGASLQAENSYGGAALGQALWSAVNSDKGVDYVRVIEMLLAAGAEIEDGSLAWLARQKGASASLKQRVAETLTRHGAKS